MARGVSKTALQSAIVEILDLVATATLAGVHAAAGRVLNHRFTVRTVRGALHELLGEGIVRVDGRYRWALAQPARRLGTSPWPVPSPEVLAALDAVRATRPNAPRRGNYERLLKWMRRWFEQRPRDGRLAWLLSAMHDPMAPTSAARMAGAWFDWPAATGKLREQLTEASEFGRAIVAVVHQREASERAEVLGNLTILRRYSAELAAPGGLSNIAQLITHPGHRALVAWFEAWAALAPSDLNAATLADALRHAKSPGSCQYLASTPRLWQHATGLLARQIATVGMIGAALERAAAAPSPRRRAIAPTARAA